MDVAVVWFERVRVGFIVPARLIVQMHVEFNSFQSRFLLASGVEVVAIQAQFLKLAFEDLEIDPQVEEGTDQHIPAESAEDIEVKMAHGRVSRGNLRVGD